MSEHAPRTPYTTIDHLLTEKFISSPEKRLEYEQQGLIATNNLGLRMKVFEAGPSSDLWQFYHDSLFTPRILERLERVRMLEPGLWSESIAASNMRAESGSKYFDALKNYGSDDLRAKDIDQQLAILEQQDTLLRSRVFSVIEQEPLTVEEAIALCV